MNDKASKVRTNAWQILFACLVLAFGIVWMSYYEWSCLTEYERDFSIKMFTSMFAFFALAILLVKPLRPITQKINTERLDEMDARFRRRFLKHPYFALLSVSIPSFGLGIAIAKFLGITPPEPHQWNVLDYGVVALMPLIVIGFVNASKNYPRTLNEVTAERHRKTDEFLRKTNEGMLNFFDQVTIFNRFYSSLVRKNPYSPRFLLLLVERMDEMLDQMRKDIETTTHTSTYTSQQDINHLMNVTVTSYPFCLFAKDVLGEAIFLKTADGQTLKIFDEDFPIPVKKTMKFSMSKDQKEGHLQLSLNENGSRVSTTYVITNVPTSRTERKTVAVTFIIDSQKAVTLQVKKPLVITKK